MSSSNKVSQAIKEYIKRNIEELTDKQLLFEIFDIIITNNPNININKQSNNMYINLNDLSNESLILINEFIKNKIPNNQSKITYQPYNTNNINLKGFNAEEKSIIEHIKYINDIKNNQI